MMSNICTSKSLTKKQIDCIYSVTGKEDQDIEKLTVSEGLRLVHKSQKRHARCIELGCKNKVCGVRGCNNQVSKCSWCKSRCLKCYQHSVQSNNLITNKSTSTLSDEKEIEWFKKYKLLCGNCIKYYYCHNCKCRATAECCKCHRVTCELCLKNWSSSITMRCLNCIICAKCNMLDPTSKTCTQKRKEALKQ